ncbi:MAG: response regulator, partial [Methyloprofundus sp.]|nr:response regulator [Methyloprofundus sp.]
MKTLIIDRVKVFQQLIASILDDSAIEHVFAASGKEALSILAKDKFDCICLALYLDDMDGY